MTDIQKLIEDSMNVGSADDIQADYEARFGRKLTYETAGNLRQNADFTTRIDKFVVDTEKKLLAVLRFSIDQTVKEASNPRTKGGKLPVLTGFLWSSGASALNTIPSGETRGDKKQSYEWKGGFLTDTLAKMKIGDTFYFGWTAEYARLMEARYGFLESALQNWQKHVDEAVRKIKER